MSLGLHGALLPDGAVQPTVFGSQSRRRIGGEGAEVHGHELVGQGAPLRPLPPLVAPQAQHVHAVQGVLVIGTQHIASPAEKVLLQGNQQGSWATVECNQQMLLQGAHSPSLHDANRLWVRPP